MRPPHGTSLLVLVAFGIACDRQADDATTSSTVPEGTGGTANDTEAGAPRPSSEPAEPMNLMDPAETTDPAEPIDPIEPVIPGPAPSSDGGGGDVAAPAATAGDSGATPSPRNDAGAPPLLVPSEQSPPVEGDGTLVGGSFEEALGSGWDLCPSLHAGLSRQTDGSFPASDGTTHLLFEPGPTCEAPCPGDRVASQVAFWLDEPLAAGVPVYLYFDWLNAAPGPPSATLVIDGVDFLCQTTETLLEVPMQDLALSGAWSTWCAELVPNAPLDVVGLHVSGTDFRLGLDAVRFGPPCR